MEGGKGSLLGWAELPVTEMESPEQATLIIFFVATEMVLKMIPTEADAVGVAMFSFLNDAIFSRCF